MRGGHLVSPIATEPARPKFTIFSTSRRLSYLGQIDSKSDAFNNQIGE